MTSGRLPSDGVEAPCHLDGQSERYADPRVYYADRELKKYCVAIIPVLERQGDRAILSPLDAGSGTCIRIAGRCFVATAAHVVPNYPATSYAVVTPVTGDGVLRVIGGGHRGGGQHHAVDVAWLELSGPAAAAAERAYLDLRRLSPYRDGVGDQLAVYGFPQTHQVHGVEEGIPWCISKGCTWFTKPLTQADLGDVDVGKRIHMEWPRTVIGHGGDSYEHPEAKGISGGGIWALNIKTHGDAWRGDQAQLIGIEFAVAKDRGYRFLVGQQMQLWLEMLAEDIPELAPTIHTHLSASRLSLDVPR